MEWLDKKGISHPVASCHCWRCHVFRLTGLVSGGRLVETESRLDLGSSKLSTELEVPREARVAETATALAFRRRWLILGVVLVGSFMAILDVFIVTQGLPSIKTTLGAGVADLELVVSAYSLAYAVFLITGGRLGDLLDRKRIFPVWHDGLHPRLRSRRLRTLSTISRWSTRSSGPRRGTNVSSGLVDYSGHFQRIRKSPSVGALRGYQRHRRDHRKHRWRPPHSAQPGGSRLETHLPSQRSSRHFRGLGRVLGSPSFQSRTSTKTRPARCRTDPPLSSLADPAAR